jgi:succinate dehydrogenase hydrophobic anchor subunit
MKRYLSLFIVFFTTTILFARGAKESPVQTMVKEWGNSFTKLVFLIIIILCIVGLIKFLSSRR